MNQNTQHTPAPWSLNGLDDHIVTSDKYTIARVIENVNDKSESQANAKLIALAPQLYDENIRLKDEIEQRVDEKINFIEERKQLKALNAELLEQLKIAKNYVDVFMIRGEEPLVGENLKTDLYTISKIISKAESKQ